MPDLATTLDFFARGPRPMTVVMAHHNTSKVMLCPHVASAMDQVPHKRTHCASTPGTFSPWSNYAESFDRQLFFQRCAITTDNNLGPKTKLEEERGVSIVYSRQLIEVVAQT